MKKTIVFLLIAMAFVLSGPAEPMNNSPGNLEYLQGDYLVAQSTPTIEVAQEYQMASPYLVVMIAPITEVAQSAMVAEVAPTLITRGAQVDLILPTNQNDIYSNQAINIIRTPDNAWTAFNTANRKFIKRGPPRTTPGSNGMGCYG